MNFSKLIKPDVKTLSLVNIYFEGCDQKLASDSSGLPGGFSGQRAWVRILKKWAPGSYGLELVVACPAAGTSAQILLVEGK
jgi:hypothetical protein